MEGFTKQALIRNLLCILIFPYQIWSNLCICKALCLDFWEILLFSLQNSTFCNFAKGFPAKIQSFPNKNPHLFHVFALCYYCIKLNFIPFVCLLSKLFILWHFHFKMSNSMLYIMFGILVQHQMCFASKNSHLL